MIRAREAGFTLVEMLAALAVLGLLSVLIVDGAGLGTRVWERAASAEARVDEIASAQAIVRGRIEALVPVTQYAGRAYTDLRGEPDKLFFYGPAASAARPDAPAVYRLSLSTGSELVLSGVGDLAPEASARRDDVLLRNVAGVEFAYFGAASPDNVRRWRDRWIQQPFPPELIRIAVRLRPGDPRVWPDLIVRPAATIDLSCVLKPLTGGCKGR